MRSLPSASGIFLACSLIITSFASTSTAHPIAGAGGKSKSGPAPCLEKHINVARMLAVEVPSAADFDPRPIAEHFKRSTVASSSNGGGGVEVYYSSSEANKQPIITMARGMMSAAEAVAFENGKVKVAGPLPLVKLLVRGSGGNATYKDLGSKVIMPGFVEPHLHILLSAMLKGYLLDVSPLRFATFAKSTAAMRAGLAGLKPGEWLACHGYDPSRMEWNDLSKKVLDEEVSSTVPIIVLNASGHLAYVNSKALELAGITKDSPQPVGGEIVKDQNGEPTGVLVEQAAIEIFAALAGAANKAYESKIPAGIATVLGQWLSRGVTTAFDAGLGTVSTDEFSIISKLAGSSPIRLHGAVSNFSPGQAEGFLGTGKMPPGGYKSGGLNIRSIKFFNDGSTQGFTAAVKENYLSRHYPQYFHDSDGNRKGLLVWPDQNVCGGSEFNVTLHSEMLKWMKRGYQILVHSNGDRSTEVVLDTYEAIFKQYPGLKRRGIMHRMEHVTVTQPAQIARAKALGLGVSHTMGHVHYWGDTFRDNILGQDRAFRIDPLADDVEYGVNYSFNSDSPVTDVNPLLWVKTAITRLTYYSNSTLGEGQKVNLEAALRGVTYNPAKQILKEDEVGTLEKGKKADFVILSEDIRKFDFAGRDLEELKILETWVGGQRQYGLSA